MQDSSNTNSTPTYFPMRLGYDSCNKQDMSSTVIELTGKESRSELSTLEAFNFTLINPETKLPLKIDTTPILATGTGTGYSSFMFGNTFKLRGDETSAELSYLRALQIQMEIAELQSKKGQEIFDLQKKTVMDAIQQDLCKFALDVMMKMVNQPPRYVNKKNNNKKNKKKNKRKTSSNC